MAELSSLGGLLDLQWRRNFLSTSYLLLCPDSRLQSAEQPVPDALLPWSTLCNLHDKVIPVFISLFFPLGHRVDFYPRCSLKCSLTKSLLSSETILSKLDQFLSQQLEDIQKYLRAGPPTETLTAKRQSLSFLPNKTYNIPHSKLPVYLRHLASAGTLRPATLLQDVDVPQSCLSDVPCVRFSLAY